MKLLTRWLFVLFSAAVAVPGDAAHAQGEAVNVLEAVDATLVGGKVVMRARFTQPLKALPANFSVPQPARIAFDVPDATSELKANRQAFSEGDLRSVVTTQVGNRLRLVLNLTSLGSYEAAVNDRLLVVTITPPATRASMSRADNERFAVATPAAPSQAQHALRDVAFRRGEGGVGRIVIDLSDATTGIDIRTQGPNLVVDFQGAEVPERLRKRLDVTDFGTPVKSVSTFPQGSNTRMLIEPTGNWEHSAYQTERQFVVEVKPVVVDPNKLTQGSRGGYTGDKLSLNFQNIDVRSVLNVIADFTDLNIITSDTVQGNITLRLKDVPWDQAFDIIMQTRGLDMRKNGNVLWVAPRDELTTKEKLELESKAQLSDLEAVRTENFQLNYTKAESMIKILTDDKQRLLSRRGSAVIDPRTNQIIVQDIPTRLTQLRQIINTLDVPVRQVMIEARIVEASDNFGRTLGVRLGVPSINSLGNAGGIAIGGNSITAGKLSGQMVPGTTPDMNTDTMSVNLPATRSSTGAQNGQIAFSLFNAGLTRFLNLELNALESDGKGKIISSPRVVTANQAEASIEQGTELPYQSATSSGATAVSFRKAVLSLKVKPQITPDGNVIMDVTVHKDSPGVQTTSGTSIDTKNVVTTVLVENGGTVVIGGIYQQTESSTVNKVPLLGDIPLLGFFFRNTYRTDNKTELLVFITPRIVDDRVTMR